jgi:ribosomal subunit interface protein
MLINIQTQGLELTEAIRDYTQKRLAYALSHGQQQIQRVQVRLIDVNGPRGGVDKRCQVDVRLKGLSSVVIEDIESDLYVAIDRAAERVGRTLARRLDKHRRFVAPSTNTESPITL